MLFNIRLEYVSIIYIKFEFGLADKTIMAMVDRYRKAGGFVQLIQVIETCNLKKREQFMKIISEENPDWADALTQKSITFEKIVSWKIEVILDVIAAVNMLSFTAALKGLKEDLLEEFLQKLSNQDKKKFEVALKESNPTPVEISASIVKIISETRNMLIQGALKADRVDPTLVIPEDFELSLDRNNSKINQGYDSNSSSAITGLENLNSDFDKIQKKIMSLTKEIQVLKQENQVMKDKLDKIKKIA